MRPLLFRFCVSRGLSMMKTFYRTSRRGSVVSNKNSRTCDDEISILSRRNHSRRVGEGAEFDRSSAAVVYASAIVTLLAFTRKVHFVVPSRDYTRVTDLGSPLLFLHRTLRRNSRIIRLTTGVRERAQ